MFTLLFGTGLRSRAGRRFGLAACIAVVSAAACEPAPVESIRVPRTIQSYALTGPRTVESNEHGWTDPARGGRPVITYLWAPKPAESLRGLVLISHGSMSRGNLHKFIGAHLASWGYVVAAPNHYGNSLGDPELTDTYANRVTDMQFVIDQIEADGKLGESVQAGVVSTGHSIGGFDALALCGAEIDAQAAGQKCGEGDELFCELLTERARWSTFRDPRARACAGMTPFVHPIFGTGGQGAASLAVPTLLIGASEDSILKLDPWLRDFAGHAPNDTRLVVIDGAGHLSFTDLLHEGKGMTHAEVKERTVAYLTAWSECVLHKDTDACRAFAPEAGASPWK